MSALVWPSLLPIYAILFLTASPVALVIWNLSRASVPRLFKVSLSKCKVAKAMSLMENHMYRNNLQILDYIEYRGSASGKCTMHAQGITSERKLDGTLFMGEPCRVITAVQAAAVLV